AFPVIALFYQLGLYGDGAMFSYAVAVRDVWAFHWHNISGRTSVFLLTLLPAEALVRITGNPWAGIIAYGLLFYTSPLIGLAVTILVFTAWLLLAFTHESALALLLVIAATLTPRGLWSATFVRAAISLAIIVILAAAAKIALPPDDYYADAFLRAALHFFDLEVFKVDLVP